MKVLFDHQAFTFQHFGGVSKCFCELIRNLPDNVNYSISIRQSANIHLRESNLVAEIETVKYDKQKYLQDFKFPGRHRVWDDVLLKFPLFKPAEKINKEYSKYVLKHENWDIFHPTFFDPYFLEHIQNKPYVITVHDMIAELYPHLHLTRQKDYKRKVVSRASAIIAVSENTKQDLCKILNVPEEKVHVIYHGGPLPQKVSERPTIEGKYFLYVGNRNGYKNFGKTVAAFVELHKQYQNIKLVCTGHSFSSPEIMMFKQYKIEDNIIYIRPTDEELKNLYSYALAFIYPSDYEGFGLPILEAYAQGCPVLLNNKSCFPEIAKDAALYFDTNNKLSLVEVMREVMNFTSEQRMALLKKEHERLSFFSWKNSAIQLSKVYESIL